MTDARTRPDDTAILSITIHQGRHSVLIGKYPFQIRKGAIVGKAIDIFVKKILEGECQNPEE
jgi:hypothetical protein